MLFLSSRAAARRLLAAPVALLLTAGAAAAQTSAYGSAPYVTQAPVGQAAGHVAQAVVYFEEPLPAPAPVKPVPAPPPAAPMPAPVLVPPVAPMYAGDEGCSQCSSGGMGGLLRGKCATCGRDSIVPPPLGFYVHSIYMEQAALARDNFFVIDPWDWSDDTDQLGRGGELHLDALVRKMGPESVAIRVAPVHDAALNAARMARLAAELRERGLGEAAALVQIGASTAEGLRSDEIRIIGGRILMGDGATRSYGGEPGGSLNGIPVH